MKHIAFGMAAGVGLALLVGNTSEDGATLFGTIGFFAYMFYADRRGWIN